MTDRYLNTDELDPGTQEAAWAAFREQKVTWINDEHNHIAAIGPVKSAPRVLTINQAGLLADLIRGVERKAKLRYYPFGGASADRPAVMVLRAFTYAEGALYPHNADIRDAHVWTSGFTENWMPVEVLIKALDNIKRKHGDNEAIAVIHYDKE